MKNLDRRKSSLSLGMLSSLMWILNPVFSQNPDVRINTDDPVIIELVAPMQLVNAGDGSNRIFIAEREGVIKVFEPDEMDRPITFLDMNSPTPTVDDTGEGGLLSIVFHPQFEDNGYFYTYYTDNAGDLILARYTAPDPEENTASTASRLQILKIPHPGATNHNGGELHFGADGYLYLSIGDGGGANDLNGDAQNSSSLLGKLLRIDVNMLPEETAAYKIPADNPFGNEVFASGLRNPFRWSFDSETNDIWIGDVGQGKREEVNHLSLAELNGANFGWRCFEGDTITPGVSQSGCGDIEDYDAPVYTYNTGSKRGRSVVGGVVYRGAAYPLMYGFYIGTDYFSGDIHKILPDGSVKTFQTSTVNNIVDIGEDESGEIYAVAGSSVYRIISENSLPVKLADFNGAADSEGVSLAWETASEENFQQFEIEYSSNSRHFEKVGTVTAVNGTGISRYRFSHAVTGTGNVYYRLKMIDNDESFEYSKIIVVKMNGEVTGNFVRPSLIDNGMMHVVLHEPYQVLEVVGSNGSVLWKKEISGMSGEIAVPMQSTAAGLYIIRLAGHDNAVQQKVLVLN